MVKLLLRKGPKEAVPAAQKPLELSFVKGLSRILGDKKDLFFSAYVTFVRINEEGKKIPLPK